jgi:hypothetical protein
MAWHKTHAPMKPLTKRGLTCTEHRSEAWSLLFQNCLCLLPVQLEQGGHALYPQFARLERAAVHVQFQSDCRHFPRLRIVTPDEVLLRETRVHLKS